MFKVQINNVFFLNLHNKSSINYTVKDRLTKLLQNNGPRHIFLTKTKQKGQQIVINIIT